MLQRAALVTRNTKNGFDFIRDDVPLGKTYWVDLGSAKIVGWGRRERPGEVFYYECIYARDGPEDTNGGYMPLELLEVEANA